jgi:ribosomal protein L16 Arg81 hydroxylase
VLDTQLPGRLSLDQLTAPVGEDRFLREYWERKTLHCRAKGAGGQDRFAPLLSSPAIDAIISGQRFREGELSLARSEPRIPPGDYVLDNGEIDRGAVMRLWQQGATIILPHLERRHTPLAQFCRQLEGVFSAHVQTNIYLTPAGAQGFHTHYDNHCVFVCQVEGRKRWRLYDTPAGTPFRGEQFTPGKFAAGEPVAEFVLEPGDMLYVPRGLMHDAVSEAGSHSLHITTGIIVKTLADFLLEAVAEASLHSPHLRRSMPPGFHRDDFDREGLRALFDTAMDEARQKADLDSVLDLFIDTFLRTRQPDLSGGIAGAPVTAETQIRRRALTPMRLAADGHHIALVMAGGDISFDEPALSALEAFIDGQSVSQADFAALGKDKAREAVERLLAFGAAERL